MKRRETKTPAYSTVLDSTVLCFTPECFAILVQYKEQTKSVLCHSAVTLAHAAKQKASTHTSLLTRNRYIAVMQYSTVVYGAVNPCSTQARRLATTLLFLAYQGAENEKAYST